MEEDIRRAQELLEERRRNLGIDPKTGRRPEMTSISENGNGRTQSQLSELHAPEDLVKIQCSSCGEFWHINKRVAERQSAPLCYDCKRADRERKEQERRVEAEAERQRERAEWLVKNIDSQLAKMGVLWEHHAASLDDFPQAIRERAVLALEDPEQFRGLLVTGSAGAGKTRLLAALVRREILNDNQVRFILARKFFRRIWATYREGAPETEDEVIADFTSCDVLLIDDLAHEGRVSEAGIGALHEVITVRSGNYLPTVITTNLTLDEISHHYDSSIASRLAAWLPIVLTGPDRRRS